MAVRGDDEHTAATLAQLVQLVESNPSLDEVFAAVAAAVKQLVPCDAVEVFTPGARGRLALAHRDGSTVSDAGGAALASLDALMHDVLAHRRS